MPAHLPPVPPAARSPKGPGQSGRVSKPHEPQQHAHDINTNEQGDPGNTRENTTNRGYQQDR